MIVKIVANEPDGMSTKMFDGVCRISYKYIAKGLTPPSGDDVLSYLYEDPQGQNIELWLWFKYKPECAVIFATCPVYITNDEGKTIERL